jgi:phage-related protein
MARPLEFNKQAKRDFDALPAGVTRDLGYALWQVQSGRMPASAKMLKGFGGADVLELRENDEAGTYRAVYTVRFAEAIYVLHAFQKKSRTGIATDKKDIDLIKERLRAAEADFAARRNKKGD